MVRVISSDVGTAIALAVTVFSVLVALVTTGAIVPDSSLGHQMARRWWWVAPTVIIGCSVTAFLVSPAVVASLFFLSSAIVAVTGILRRPADIVRPAHRGRRARDIDDRPAARTVAVAVAVGLQVAGVVVLFAGLRGA